MSGALVQNLIVGAAALAALGWLARRWWRARNSSTPCPSCPVAGACMREEKSSAPPLIQIESLGTPRQASK